MGILTKISTEKWGKAKDVKTSGVGTELWQSFHLNCKILHELNKIFHMNCKILHELNKIFHMN